MSLTICALEKVYGDLQKMYDHLLDRRDALLNELDECYEVGDHDRVQEIELELEEIDEELPR
jgi:hypothetical protein